MEEESDVTSDCAQRRRVAFYRQCFVSSVVTINMMTNGCVMGYSAVLIPSLREYEARVAATEDQISWVASVQGISLIIGNIISTPAMDILGRKKSHILSVLPILTGWLLILFAQNVSHIIIGRFIQGFSMGILIPLSSIIISEMTDPKSRGPFLTLISLALTMGILFTQTIGSFLHWQTTGVLCFILSFIGLLMVVYTPESPSWKLSKGEVEECRRIFHWLRGSGSEEREELEHMIEIQTMVRKSSLVGEATCWMKVRRWIKYLRLTYKKPEFYKPIILMLHMNIMIQFCGLNVLVSYMTDVLRIVIDKNTDVYTWMITLNIERLISNILFIYFMKITKRRTLLFLTGSLCVATLFLQAAYVLVKENGWLPFDSICIPVALLGLYIFAIGGGFLGLPMAIAGEIFPLEFRGLGGGISMFIGSIFFFAAIKLFPGLVSNIGLPYTYFLYGSVVVYCLVVVWVMLPETKDKTLQEIEDGFRGVEKCKQNLVEMELLSKKVDN